MLHPVASFIDSRLIRVLVPVLLAGTVLLPTAALGAQAAAPAKPVAIARQASSSRWVTYDPATKTVHLTLVSAYGQDTYNFNGGTAGKFRVTVPLGSRVIVTYSNQSLMMMHGAEIVPWTGTLPTGTPPAPAFSGAASPNYLHGTPRGVTQTFTFTAGKAGKYLIICPVRNHVKFGHWAWFTVSRTAKTAKARLAA